VRGLENHLAIGKEIAIYTTPEECAQQCRYYLSNDALRREVARNGHLRTVGEHTFAHRLTAILGRIFGAP
jgi:spore maturation protein CgeB